MKQNKPDFPLSPEVTTYLHAHVDGALLFVRFIKGRLRVLYVPDDLELMRLFPLPKNVPTKWLCSYFGEHLFRRQRTAVYAPGTFFTIDLGAEYCALERAWGYRAIEERYGNNVGMTSAQLSEKHCGS